jgi:hypothetical protein
MKLPASRDARRIQCVECGNFALSIARNLSVGLQFTRGTRIFVKTGCYVRHATSPGRSCVSDATVEQLRESFVRNPRKSRLRASREIGSHIELYLE